MPLTIDEDIKKLGSRTPVALQEFKDSFKDRETDTTRGEARSTIDADGSVVPFDLGQDTKVQAAQKNLISQFDTTPPDETAIREQTRKQMQEQIDAINAAAVQQIEEARLRSEKKQKEFGGTERAIQSKSGLLGQEFGLARQQKLRTGIEKATASEVRGIEVEKQRQLAQVFGAIETRADARLKQEAEDARTGATLQLEFLQQEQDQARADLALLSQGGVGVDQFTLEQKAELMKQGGFKSELTFEAFYNAAKSPDESVKYSYMELSDGTFVRVGDDGTEKNIGNYAKPEDNASWELEEVLTDGTLAWVQRNEEGNVIDFKPFEDNDPNVTQETREVNGQLVRFSYDKQGNVVNEVSLGAVTSGIKTYQETREILNEDGEIRVKRLVYDPQGNLINEVDLGQSATQKINNSGLDYRTQTQIDSIAKGFDTHQIVKNFIVVQNKRESVQRIIDSDVGGAGDLALIFEFMKALDPNSVVRESEYAAAAKSGNIFVGVYARFNGYWKAEGGFMPPALKNDFMEITNQKYQVVESQYQNLYSEYGRRIDRKTGVDDGTEYLTNYNFDTSQSDEVDYSQYTKDELQQLFDEGIIGGRQTDTGIDYLDPVTGEVIKKKDEIAQFKEAIAEQESGGNYRAIGKETGKGKAYGKYQVMDFNIPTWTREVLGRAMTPQEFLNDSQAQDKVAEVKMQQIFEKHGNLEDVASVWFSGRPIAGNTSKDVTGTSVPRYVKNVISIFNRKT
mgnify:CR=1 FL=1|jgi:YD repeat-containing protein|tara:strand:- start:14460 stop:16670 length:2211 start_codon:yes stop_codon:yes gene_type:complete